MEIKQKPRIYILLWIAFLGGLVALGCRELESMLLANFPGAKVLIHVGVIVVFALAFTHVAIKPFFAEIGKPLR